FDAQSKHRRRLKIWEIREHMECSVVGTCLADSDLKKILKRCGLRCSDDVPSYDLHGYFTQNIKKDCPVSRAVQKLLDRRHEGIVRRVARSEGDDLTQLWETEFEAGRIPGAYWAFQTHSHIPTDLHARIFGEVHMLSHVLGRTVHATAERASEFQARISDLEVKLTKQSNRQKALLEKRDQQISELRDALVQSEASNRSHEVVTVLQPTLNDSGAAKQKRALVSARERARQAEARVEELEAALKSARATVNANKISSVDEASEAACPGAAACKLHLPDGEQLRVLYLGGRAGGVNRLREIAEGASAELVYHDGGKLEGFGRIEDLISQCHVVFCPVNCISHRACLLAKDQCRRRQKAFVPLRSAGSSTFARALQQIEYV
ncbi:MAG: DUF2325 domain-containing protein, partial [Pseudomonadota bacterium]